MNLSAALPTFLITLREGFEAALVVGIVLSCLQKAQQNRLKVWVWYGVGAGIAASVVTGWLLRWGLGTIARSDHPAREILQPLLETGFAVLAIAMLSWMLIWMTQQARSLKAELEGAVQSALAQSNQAKWGVFGLVAIAVLREGFETVLFLTAQFSAGQLPIVGAGLGLVGAALLGVALFAWGVRINLGRFFQVMGILLLFVVAGLVVSALKNFNLAIDLAQVIYPQFQSWCNATADSCLLGVQLWDLHEILSDRDFPGVVFKLLLGYRDRFYELQAVAYILFLAIVGGFYFQSLKPKA